MIESVWDMEHIGIYVAAFALGWVIAEAMRS